MNKFRSLKSIRNSVLVDKSAQFHLKLDKLNNSTNLDIYINKYLKAVSQSKNGGGPKNQESRTHYRTALNTPEKLQKSKMEQQKFIAYSSLSKNENSTMC